jgi:SNF2 family DNA or RNA helicase
MIVLDEAQYIKNSQAKVTQSICGLNTIHRLCLTGTPMENHLGELWSLFHFLMPGLLRDLKSFNKNYRHPIEKNSDQDKRARLIKLTKPFMLRRTKAAVAPELPEKIEMIRYVELSGPQRDFYETIRIAMNEKIQKEISRLGFAKSQIIILDALLKLRQVCCHPQLVKTQSTKKKV